MPPGFALGSPNGLPLRSAGQLPSQPPPAPPQLPSDLPPGLVTSPASRTSIGRPDQLPSQLPSDLPPGFGTAPINSLAAHQPNRQPSQGRHVPSVSDILPRPDLAQAVSHQVGPFETGLTSQTESNQTGSAAHGKSRKAVLGQAAASQSALKPVTPGKDAAAQPADLPPGFGAGHQGLRSAAVQSREADMGGNSGDALPHEQRQRLQQVVAILSAGNVHQLCCLHTLWATVHPAFVAHAADNMSAAMIMSE